MPLIPGVIAMLACARLGAVHSVVFGDFAPNELAVRIEDAQPKVVVSASCGIEPSSLVEYKPMLDRALELATHQPGTCLIKQRPQLRAEMTAPRDVDWDDAMTAGARNLADCVEVAATDPLYVRYDRQAEGDRAGQRGSCGRYGVVVPLHLRQRSGAGVVGGFRRRVGRRPQLHRVCPV